MHPHDKSHRCALTYRQTDTGANASAEEAEDALEEGSETVNNLVYSFRLQPTQFDKKTYFSYLKGYLKSVKDKMAGAGATPDEIKDWETKASAFVKKKLLPNFGDYEFYTGESMDVDGM